MKIAALILAAFNTLPLAIWIFIAAPVYHMTQQSFPAGETAVSRFCGYGFLWGSLLFPLILILNHVFFLRNYLRQDYRPALINQLITLAYLALVLTYGLIAFH